MSDRRTNLAGRFPGDLTILIGEEWLTAPEPETDPSMRQRWEQSPLFVAIAESRLLGLEVECTGDFEAVSRLPAPASLSRLKNEYRLQSILKGINRRVLRETLDMALADAEHNGCDIKTINVEIDPVNLM